MKHWKVALGLIPAFLAVSGAAHTQTLAFDVASGTVGSQNFGGSLGLDFNVVSTIQVTQLGFFDSGSNGIQGANTAITVKLFDRNSTTVPLATQTFTFGNDGALAAGSGFRFKTITPLILTAGSDLRLVAYGFDDADHNGNTGIPPDPAATRNNGGGLISFPLVGGNYVGFHDDGSQVYPIVQDANTYLAGSLQYQQFIAPSTDTPEPGALALLTGVAIPGFLFTYRRMRRKKA